MFQILDTKKNSGRKMPEIFRYDQVMGYEKYDVKSSPTDGKPAEITEAGIKINFTLSSSNKFMENKDSRPHPFVEKEIKVCIANSAFEYNKDNSYAKSYIDNIIRIFDRIFGVNDNESALFSFGPTKEEKRQITAVGEFAKGMSSIIKAQKNGDEDTKDSAKEQLQKAGEAMDDARTHGLSVYSRYADEAENKIFVNT